MAVTGWEVASEKKWQLFARQIGFLQTEGALPSKKQAKYRKKTNFLGHKARHLTS